MGLTARVCDLLAGIGHDRLSDAARAAARRLVADGIAIAIAGTTEPAIGLLTAHEREQGSAPACTALGQGFRLGPVAAARLNGAAMHVLDYEPMWSPATHALSTTLPAILALAERGDVSGKDVLTALVKGIEIQGWLREASGVYEARNHAFHPPGVVGPLGAAVAAGHLLGLDPGRMGHAIGIAASRAGSLLANAGTMTKSTHCGNACAAGLDAALLAARGFTAEPTILESPRGFGAAFSHDGFQGALLERIGPPFRIVVPGYALKMFPSQYGTHFGITAALELRRKIADPARIRAVTFTAPDMPYVNRPLPETGLAGKFSLQYTVAAALLDGAVAIRTFTDARAQAPDIRALLSRITLVTDPDIPARFEKMHVRLEAELDDGTRVATRCDGPRGHWSAAPVPDADHRRKLEDCLATRMPADAAARLLDRASAIETLDPAGVRALIATAGLFTETRP